MGRRLRTAVPTKSSLLNPSTPDPKQLAAKEKKRIEMQKDNYDKRHGTRKLEELQPGSTVWITDLRRSGIIEKRSEEPRSYIINTEKRTIRRNQYHLIPIKGEEEEDDTYNLEDMTPSEIETPEEADQQAKIPQIPPAAVTQPEHPTTRSGCVSKKSKRLIEDC